MWWTAFRWRMRMMSEPSQESSTEPDSSTAPNQMDNEESSTVVAVENASPEVIHVVSMTSAPTSVTQVQPQQVLQYLSRISFDFTVRGVICQSEKSSQIITCRVHYPWINESLFWCSRRPAAWHIYQCAWRDNVKKISSGRTWHRCQLHMNMSL